MVRIGVLIHALQPLPTRVLSYLITYQNTLQSSFLFEVLPSPDADPFLAKLAASNIGDHESIVPEVDQFVTRYKQWLNGQSERYNLKVVDFDTIAILSDAQFTDLYYYIDHEDWSLILLGGWKRRQAPPSIVEYYLTFLDTVAIIAATPGAVSQHYGITGCAMDFNESISSARYATLCGYLCPDCASALENGTSKQVLADANLLLKRSWLGGSAKPSDVAVNVKKLGYDLFHTTGLRPTFAERVRSLIEQEGI